MSLLIDTSFKLRGYIESQIGGRMENQDSAGAMETPIGTIVVVCDGMGGVNGGRIASMLAVKTIIDVVSEAKADDNPEDVLVKAFLKADKAIIEAASDDTDLKGMGTTATAALFSKHHATVAHIGDSRIYQFRNGQKMFRTNDHSLVYQFVAAGTLTEEQARLSAQSNIILRALGGEEDATPDVQSLPYLKGDRFVLCTDGFWGGLPEEEFVKLIAKRGRLKDILWNATKEINKQGIESGGGHDNLTAAVIDMECESLLKSPMSKNLKIFLLCVILLLVISLCANILFVKKFRNERIRLDAAREYVEVLNESSSSDKIEKARQVLVEAFSEETEGETSFSENMDSKKDEKE